MSPMRRLAGSIAVIWILYYPARTFAHDLPISNMTIVAAEESMHVELMLNAAELSFFSEIDRDKDGILDPAEVKSQSEQISRKIIECFSFSIDGKPIPAAVHGVVPDLGSHHLTIRAHYPCDAREAPVYLESSLVSITQRSHVIEVTFHRPDRRQTARLDAHDHQILFNTVAKHNLTTALRNPRKPVDMRHGAHILFGGLAVLLGCLFLYRGLKS